MSLPQILHTAPCGYPILSIARGLLLAVLLSLTAAAAQAAGPSAHAVSGNDAALQELPPGTWSADVPEAGLEQAGFVDTMRLESRSLPFHVRDTQAGGAIVATGSVEHFILRAADGRLGFFYRVYNSAESSVPIWALRLGGLGTGLLHVGRIADDSLPSDGIPNYATRFGGSTGIATAEYVNFSFLADAVPPGQRSALLLVKTMSQTYQPTGNYDVTTGAYQSSARDQTFAPGHVAALMSLTHSAPGMLSPNFAPAVQNYQLIVPHGTHDISITPTLAYVDASVSINGQSVASGMPSPALPLNIGSNRVDILVSAGDGTTQREYTIDTIRLSTQPVALSVTIERMPNGFVAGSGEIRHYRITTINLGHQAAGSVQLTIPLPAGLTDVLWTCHAPAPCTPEQGQNAVAVTFVLGSGQSAHVDLSGEVMPGVAFIDLRASASSASTGISAQGNASEPANGIGVLKNGFE